jgi:hypothetical protein
MESVKLKERQEKRVEENKKKNIDEQKLPNANTLGQPISGNRTVGGCITGSGQRAQGAWRQAGACVQAVVGLMLLFLPSKTTGMGWPRSPSTNRNQSKRTLSPSGEGGGEGEHHVPVLRHPHLLLLGLAGDGTWWSEETGQPAAPPPRPT